MHCTRYARCRQLKESFWECCSYNIARGLPTQAKSPAVRLHIKIDDKVYDFVQATKLIRCMYSNTACCAACGTRGHSESHTRYIGSGSFACGSAASISCWWQQCVQSHILYLSAAAHEVVEVDGFVFKRKRAVSRHSASQQLPNLSAEKNSRTPVAKHTASPLAAATPAPTPAGQFSHQADDTATGKAADAAADAAAIRTPTAQIIAAATTALLEQVPTDMAEPDRLASLCELLCAAELEELHQHDAEAQLDPVVAAAVQNALGAFVRSVQSAAANGSFQVRQHDVGMRTYQA